MAKQPFQKMSDEDYIVSFCDITGASVEEAGMYLEMSGFDLDKAVSLYFDNGIQPREAVEAPPNAIPDPVDEMEEEEESASRVGRIYNSQGREKSLL